MYIGKPNPYFHIYLFPYCPHLLTRNWTLDLTLAGNWQSAKGKLLTVDCRLHVFRKPIEFGINNKTGYYYRKDCLICLGIWLFLAYNCFIDINYVISDFFGTVYNV